MTDQGLTNEVKEYHDWIKEVLISIKDILEQRNDNVCLKNVSVMIEQDYSRIFGICEDSIGYLEMLESEVLGNNK